MATCELCGREEASFVIEVEGTQVGACKNCSKHGRIIRGPQMPRAQVRKPSTPDPIPVAEQQKYIVSDYGTLIRSKRQQLALEQKDFAAKLGIKESLLHKIETNSFEPDIDLARRLEKTLHITLVEQANEAQSSKGQAKRASSVLTIGDVIQLKGKKL